MIFGIYHALFSPAPEIIFTDLNALNFEELFIDSNSGYKGAYTPGGMINDWIFF